MLRSDEIKKQYLEVMDRMAGAAIRSGRKPEAVKLVAVSKRFPVEDIFTAANAGASLFGESRPQELDEKFNATKTERGNVPGFEFQMIGHLQRNKVKLVVGHCSLIHSVDSLRLAKAIDERAEAEGIVQSVLLQVNISTEENKFGIEPGQLVTDGAEFLALRHVQVAGLMGMAANSDDLELIRGQFRKLSKLRDAFESTFHVSMPELSMGMSDDFEIAIEEGATLIRVGSLIFGHRD